MREDRWWILTELYEGEIAGSGVYPQDTREQGSTHESGSSMRKARRTGADSGGWYHGDITRVVFAANIRPGAGELTASSGHLLHLFVRFRFSLTIATNTIDPRAHPRSQDASPIMGECANVRS